MGRRAIQGASEQADGGQAMTRRKGETRGDLKRCNDFKSSGSWPMLLLD